MARTPLILIALVAAWVALTLFMWFTATRSFSAVDRILTRPPAQLESAVKPLGGDQRREVLRFVASEINRTRFKAS